MIQIRFDGPPGPVAGRFVEVENELGESIKVGEWRDDGIRGWLLVLPFEVCWHTPLDVATQLLGTGRSDEPDARLHS